MDLDLTPAPGRQPIRLSDRWTAIILATAGPGLGLAPRLDRSQR